MLLNTPVYSNSFIIPNFTMIKTASILVDGLSYGIATREDYSWALTQANKVSQKLVKNEKLKAKLDPCTKHKFSVKMTFNEDPFYIYSSQSEYVPGKMEQVSNDRLFALFWYL